MQVLSVGLARSVWLFDLNELNPKGKSIFPDALLWLGDKYAFEHFPKSNADVDTEKKGFVFKTGEFKTDEGPVSINLSIHTDGMIAETWASTEKGDQFLDEILSSAASKYGLPFSPQMIRKKLYVSEVRVRLDGDFSKLGQNFMQFCNSLNRVFGRHNLPPFEMTGIVFSPDTSEISYKPPGFMVERKTGVPFGDNCFWSKSPFTTKDHLAALEEFEKLLAG